MCEILAFLAEMVKRWPRKNIFGIPLYPYRVIFITEFVLLIKIPPFYGVNLFNRKWQVNAWRDFKNIFLYQILGQKC